MSRDPIDLEAGWARIKRDGTDRLERLLDSDFAADAVPFRQAETMALYDVRHMTDEITRLSDLSVRCCERVKDAVNLLDKIADMGTAEAALKTCEEIDRLESDADRVMRSAMSKLFREEPDVREVIKLKAIYELLETITDKCEDVANVIEGIVLEHS